MAILRERLREDKPVAEVCERHYFQTTVFCSWQKKILENGAAFERKSKPAEDAKDQKIATLLGMAYIRTSPGNPQSNGELQLLHGTIKAECIRPGPPLSLDEARRLLDRRLQHDDRARLHCAWGGITPSDRVAGREKLISFERGRKVDIARERRQANRQAACAAAVAEPVMAM